MKRISQLKLKGYYRNALTLVAIGAEQDMLRAWLIKNRRVPTEKGSFALRVLPVKTVSVDLKLLRERIEQMPKALRKRFMQSLKGCTRKGKSFRVEVFPRIK